MKALITDQADVVIVGAGAAGLFAALTLAPRRVIVLSERLLGGICASCWSQGGIAAAVGKEDAPGDHAADTLKAAAGTADINVVRALTAEAPRYIDLLARYGVLFDRDEEGDFRLSREACHGRRRVLKARTGDGFGFELMRALVEAVRNTPSITIAEEVSAEHIIRESGFNMGAVQGVLVRRLADQQPVIYAAPAVLLATGGIGGLYAGTTNPLGAVGKGLAMAARTGAVLSDLEFVQFHPTALDIGEDPMPLASEALRGEGAFLVNSRGVRFMEEYHEMGDLAPRDIVSRSIEAERRKGQKTYLDCRMIDTFHFPALRTAAARVGLDPQHDLIPVAPAAHYHMGGIATGLDGRSSVYGLWAAGEAAATGLHGANRLASNSLMEAVVMAGRAADDIGKFLQIPRPVKDINLSSLPQIFAGRQMLCARETIRRIMSDCTGVVRDGTSLRKAMRVLERIGKAVALTDSKTADMALVARMIAVSALARTESRGGHYRSDCPETLPAWQKRSFTTLKEMDMKSVPVMRRRRQRSVA